VREPHRPAREGHAPTRPGRTGHRRRAVALTGTPGVGKSAVGRALRGEWSVVEVADLARATGTARRLDRGTEVDLPRLVVAVRSSRVLDSVDVIVGHLAHLLPVREAIVLRCHPLELRRRLDRARRGRRPERAENVVCEALDLVLLEASSAGRRIYEVDTTGRSVASVAREVDRWLRRRAPLRSGTVDWLADPRVTAHLLDGAG